MPVKLRTKDGDIDISNKTIATVVGVAATDVFGVVGMSSKNQFKDNLNEILNKENYSRGVVIRPENGNVAIDVYLVVGYGVKISEVSKNAQQAIAYNLKNQLSINPSSINITVQSVKVIDD